MIRRLLPWLKWLVPLAVAFFIGRAIYIQWHRVRAFEWRFDPLFLALSFAASSCWFFARAFVWRAAVTRFGYTIPYRETVRIFVLSELSRYVPGAVWQYFSRIYLAGLWGVPASAAVSSALMELLLLALAAIPLVLWHIGDLLPIVGRAQQALLGAFPAVAVILLQPRVLNRIGMSLLPRFHMQYSPIHIRFRETAGLWGVCLLVWVAFGAGFVLFARSLTPIAVADSVQVVSEYAASWLIGVITIFAPGGIGVREGILGLLLSRIMPLGTALVIAVLSRIWLVLLELLWAAAAQLWLHVPAPAGPKGR